MVDILWSQLASLWIQSTLTLPPPEIAPIPGSAPFLKMAQIFSSIWFCAKFSTEEEKNIGEARQLFLSYIFWQMICLIFKSLCPILPASYSEKINLNLKVSMRGVNCIWNFLFAIIGFRFPSDLDKPWFLLPSSSWKKKTFFQTLIRQVAGRGRTHWECRCARQRPIGHLSYLKTTTGINRTFSMPHIQLLLASRLAEDEERQLRAAIERVIRIFKSRLFQVRN